MRTFSAKVAFIHWTHQNLVRIFGMFAFYAYFCHAMPLMILLVLNCSTKISEKSDMAKIPSNFLLVRDL